jgi:hypothetical protein
MTALPVPIEERRGPIHSLEVLSPLHAPTLIQTPSKPSILRREHKQLVPFCQAYGNCRKASTRLSNTLRLVLVPLLYSTDAVDPTIVAIHGLNKYCGQTWTGDGCARVMRPT